MIKEPRDNYKKKVQPYLSDISQWMLEGKSFDDIYRFLNVSKSAFQRYRKLYPELDEAIDSGREYLVKKVEDTFYKRLLGITRLQKIKTRFKYDADGNKTIEWQEVSEEPVYANTADYVFFLTQYPDKWVNRQDVRAKFEGRDYRENQETVLDQLSKKIARKILKQEKDKK